MRVVYTWVDDFDLSRPKKNINRDFSDAMLVAEIVRRYQPTIVDVNNFPAANNTDGKRKNWNFLNEKVLKKIGMKMSPTAIEDLANAKPLAIESFLYDLKSKLENPASSGTGATERLTATLSETKRAEQLSLVKSELNKEQNRSLSPAFDDLADINYLHERIETLEKKFYSLKKVVSAKDRRIHEFEKLLIEHGLCE